VSDINIHVQALIDRVSRMCNTVAPDLGGETTGFASRLRRAKTLQGSVASQRSRQETG
jgi:hypothetical protein